MNAVRMGLLGAVASLSLVIAVNAAPAQTEPASAPSGTAKDEGSSGQAAAPKPLSKEEQLVQSMNLRRGVIPLPGGKATVTTAKGFAYLDPADAKTLLVEIFGNPPDVTEGVLGVILPDDIDPLASESWVAVLTYEDDGHVADDDAAAIDYTELLATMKEETAEASKARAEAGYGTMELVGWAQKPSYDKVEHKLYWAKELRFQGADVNTLNYAIRILGRTGVLQVNVVAGMNQIQQINPRVPELLRMVKFEKGQTYADFNEGTDAVAAYGLAGLIAGGAAAKAGLFKGLLAMLLASKKLLAALVVGLGAAVWAGIKRLRGSSQG